MDRGTYKEKENYIGIFIVQKEKDHIIPEAIIYCVLKKKNGIQELAHKTPEFRNKTI